MHKVIKSISKYAKDSFAVNKLDVITVSADKYYQNLLKRYKDDPKKLKKQTLNNMFPVISFYKAMLENEVEQPLAFNLLKDFKADESLKSAKNMGKLLSLFGLYKQYPTIFKKVTVNSFGKDIGFDPYFVVANKTQCKFDMKECVFCKRCKELDCFELVPVFCNTDVVFNSNLHKNIIWKRKSTLGEGADCCDFDVSLKPKDK